jgi:hypothetical protein
MQKRGRILRDPISGPGLLMVEGQQYPFSLEGVWRSEAPPTAGMVVDVEFDSGSRIVAVTAVAESQIAKEQAEVALAAAKEKGAALASGMVAKFGAPSLIAAGLLIVSWFFLTTASIKSPLGSIEFTFWQVLGYLNAKNIFEVMMSGGRGGPSAGIYGFFAIAALAGPFVHHFWKDRRAKLGGLLPLLFMIVIALAVRSSINSAFGAEQVGADMRTFVDQAREEAMKAVSIGMGAYLAIAVSLYLAAVSLKSFLVAQATTVPVSEKSHRAAA